MVLADDSLVIVTGNDSALAKRDQIFYSSATLGGHLFLSPLPPPPFNKTSFIRQTGFVGNNKTIFKLIPFW